MEQLTAEQLLQSIWMALRRIEDNMALPPAPLELPPIPPPDLSEVVTAVTNLRPMATADDIARALADVLSPRTDNEAGDALRQVAEGLKTLDHRLQGFGKQAYGGGSVTFAPQQLSALTTAITNTTAIESRLDYDGRTDDQPVYVGHADPGTATTATTWRVEKVTYDGTDRPVRKQLLTGAWDSRASLSW